jgi:hypothetical protein
MSQNRSSLLLRAGLVALATPLALSATTAFADLYSVRVVTGTQGESFVAGDDYGDYTLNATITAEGTHKCGSMADPAGNTCYQTYYADTKQTVYSFTAPKLPTYSSPTAGSGCGFSLSDYEVVFHELCDNGHEIISGVGYAPGRSQGILGLFDGPNAVTDEIYRGSLDGRDILTTNGNLFYDDGQDDTMNVAIDLSTSPVPEPSSLVLLATGALATAELLRRRKNSQPSA